MSITREQLTEHLDVLKRQHDQDKANLHALEGAIQSCEHWLRVLDEQEARKENLVTTPC